MPDSKETNPPILNMLQLCTITPHMIAIFCDTKQTLYSITAVLFDSTILTNICFVSKPINAYFANLHLSPSDLWELTTAAWHFPSQVRPHGRPTKWPHVRHSRQNGDPKLTIRLQRRNTPNEYLLINESCDAVQIGKVTTCIIFNLRFRQT